MTSKAPALSEPGLWASRRERWFPNGEWILLLALVAETVLFAVIAPNFATIANFFEVIHENPFKGQAHLQDMMQDLVGIVRKEDEMVRALDGLEKLRARAVKVQVTGNREYNPGWHTAMDLHSLLTVSEAVTLAAIQRKESRGAQFRDDYPKKDNAKFGASSPGISVAAGEWLASKEVVVVGSDNWGVEAFPSQDPNVSAPVHQLLLAKNGIYLHENLATEVLARDNVYEFAYVFAPLRLKGATGSPGNPVAIR